ncbi:PREDICTED: uncharacterized protein LOC109350561 [Lupinus angustifolius]|uniref:uncharacterized protein LOC109350561 n=1 Tax=Lupinus angustifolius TaxID=3871 RepID=UPI00092F2560|nr:PREDICTED: uncharacterized protein LOC109350561 [Lupinus angustifolius]
MTHLDHSFFLNITSSSFTGILVYVDDLILAGKTLDEINRMKQLLNCKFNIKDLGGLKFFLGMEVARSSKGILLYQRKYTLELLQHVGMLASKPCSKPMDYSGKLIHSQTGHYLANPSSYRRLIGKLFYLTHTRPDISFEVGHLSQFLSKPIYQHYSIAIRILKYLKGSPSTGIFFYVHNSHKLKAYSDVYWGGHVLTPENQYQTIVSSLGLILSPGKVKGNK